MKMLFKSSYQINSTLVLTATKQY